MMKYYYRVPNKKAREFFIPGFIGNGCLIVNSYLFVLSSIFRSLSKGLLVNGYTICFKYPFG